MYLIKRNKMINYIKSKFRKPTPLEMVSRELEEALLARLEAQTASEYAQSVVEYNNVRIKRLEALRSYL